MLATTKMDTKEREKIKKMNMEKAIMVAREEKREQCQRLDKLRDIMKSMNRAVVEKVSVSSQIQ